jgi:hypothetical protein
LVGTREVAQDVGDKDERAVEEADNEQILCLLF